MKRSSRFHPLQVKLAGVIAGAEPVDNHDRLVADDLGVEALGHRTFPPWSRSNLRPDLVRGIYPTAKIVNETGITDVPEQQIRAIYDEMIASRRAKEK